jgi:phage shock protein B
MNGVFIVAIVFGSIIIAMTIISGTILMAIRLRHGGVSQKDRKNLSEEARMIQEIYNGIRKMEDRVDALETILMDQKKKE